MNKAILKGRLVRDPETKYLSNEEATAVTKFTIAVNRKIRREGDSEADFINCVAFGKQGEFIDKWFKKGSAILLSGRIQTGSYTNKEGQKVYTTDVVVEESEFGEKKNGSDSQGSAPANGVNGNEGFMNVPEGIDEDLPFAKPTR